MKGRKPKPVEQRLREGNPGKRPLPATIVAGGRPTPTELVEPPDVIGVDGQRWWLETVPMAAEGGLLDRVDRTQLTFMAVQYDDWAKARRVLAVDGHFATGSKGQIREHPALKIARDAQHAFDRLAEAFGLNPMARTRLGLQQLQGRALLRDLDTSLDAESESEVDVIVVDVGLPGA